MKFQAAGELQLTMEGLIGNVHRWRFIGIVKKLFKVSVQGTYIA